MPEEPEFNEEQAQAFLALVESVKLMQPVIVELAKASKQTFDAFIEAGWEPETALVFVLEQWRSWIGGM